MVTTTTLPRTTTTIDRFAEIEAIITDLEERRLDALYREDESAYRELFANEEYLRRSLEVLGQLEFVAPPIDLEVRLEEIVADTGECVALRIGFDYVPTLGPDAAGSITFVLERRPDGLLGYSFGGAGWDCAGPHPFS